MQFNVMSPDQFRTVAWKNGKGSTKELVFGGASEDSFDWRLSMAPVITDGEFSDFEHYDRTLVLINGNGLTLDYDNGQQDVLSQRFDMAHFDGGWRTSAKLHDGGILDFNVMTRQGRCRSDESVLEGSKGQHLSVSANLLFIYSVDSEISILLPDSSVVVLPGDHLFRTDNAEAGQWHVSGGAVVCVQISAID